MSAFAFSPPPRLPTYVRVFRCGGSGKDFYSGDPYSGELARDNPLD
jgi:hypothetical protein